MMSREVVLLGFRVGRELAQRDGALNKLSIRLLFRDERLDNGVRSVLRGGSQRLGTVPLGDEERGFGVVGEGVGPVVPRALIAARAVGVEAKVGAEL